MRERVHCPICRAECARQGNPFRPFCSERCRMIDLSNWLGERYRIPGEPAVEERDDPSEPEDDRARSGGAGPREDGET